MAEKEFNLDDEELPEIDTGTEINDLPEEAPEYEFEAQEDQSEPIEEESDEREEAPVQAKKPKKSVQERINKAVRAQREAERRELETRQRLELLEQRLSQNEDRHRATEYTNLESEHNTLRQKHKAALENEDWGEAEEISDKILDVKLKKQQFENIPRQQPAQQQQQPGPDPKTAKWIRENSDWWQIDEEKTIKAIAIDTELKLRGYNPEDDDFWEELDNRLSPKQRKRNRPSQAPVAGAERGGPPRNKNKIMITKEMQHTASELGIKPGGAEWDRYLKEVQKGNPNA